MGSFHRPNVTTSLFVTVMAEANHHRPHTRQGGTTFFVDYEPNETRIKVGVTEPSDQRLGAFLHMAPSDMTIDMQLLVDDNITEVLWMGGRTVVKADTPATKAAGMTVGASTHGVMLSYAIAYKEEVWESSACANASAVV